MSDVAIVLLGKFGDCANILPVAKHLYDSRNTPALVCHMNYSPLLRGVTYCKADPVHFPLTRTDLAMEYARNKYADVRLAQIYGRTYQGPKEVSYNELAWQSVGYGEHFKDTKNFPLIFDRRDAEREKFLMEQNIEGGRPLVLLSVGCGRSSPFAAHYAFGEAIRRKHGHYCEIVDLCKVKAARLYDWLGLFDRASLLITADTAALHLAAASPKLKVIALVNDKPFLATSPRCNVVLKATYSEVTGKMADIHAAIGQAVAAGLG